MPPEVETRLWRVSGHIQGVGYRPFVYRIANRYSLSGWVINKTGTVNILARGKPEILDSFSKALANEAPVIARPVIAGIEKSREIPKNGFSILPSEESHQAQIYIPPDYFMCGDCQQELMQPDNRRYRYPFINCTQCGPRYTLIKRLPYDRLNTTMQPFKLCKACQEEYQNPLDRRFHAEPIACPDCGPSLTFLRDGIAIKDTEQALQATIEALRHGLCIAVKGIGGYHLLVDAENDVAIEVLRKRKQRPHKPLAVMFPDIESLHRAVNLTETEAALLCSAARPIVLGQKQADSTVSEFVAPGLSEVGVMLPYSPLHYLLLHDFAGPLVATSANISGEPVLTENQDVDNRLAHVADAFLHHDRPIQRPADDSVFRTIQGVPRPLRLGRGQAPIELKLPVKLTQPVLAVGGHMKNTVALAWGERVVVSAHIGDLDSPRSLQVFNETINTLQDLYKVQPAQIISDAHPGYGSTRWAMDCGLPVASVFHHHAHASALYAESFPGQDELLVFTWDGTGLGEDGTIQGGETFYGKPSRWERVGSFRPFFLPGGDKAGREPWRSAAALCWEAGLDFKAPDAIVRQAWKKKINAPESTAAGRLFDAAAALIGLCTEASFEGQGPMLLEACADQTDDYIQLPASKDKQATWRSDWEPLLQYLMSSDADTRTKAAVFHNSLARNILSQTLCHHEEKTFDTIGLCGGVFQNRRLVETVVPLLENEGFKVILNQQLPTNDGGLSYGQVIEFAFRSKVV